MSTLTLAELTYEQAQKALEQQERQVSELRQRSGILIAAASLVASFGMAVLGRDGLDIPIALAGISLTVTLSGLYVLYPHTMVFAFDARYLYEMLKPEREDAERVHLLLAFGLRDTRDDNGLRVDRLSRCVGLAAAALVFQIACWTWALVLL